MKGALMELLNPDGKMIFNVQDFDNADNFEALNRYNFFAVLLILEGDGTLKADITDYPFQKYSLISLSLYQPFQINSTGVFKSVMVNFHPEFFCLHKHRNEVSCNGVLFNNIYESPIVDLTEIEAKSLLNVFEGFKSEMRRPGKPDPDILISYLKILLIDASRLKIEKRGTENDAMKNRDPEILKSLRSTIEEHFRSKHSPADYADLLSITPSALNRLSKTHFNKTLSDLIAERLITESKRELYLTAKPVKLIAYELGFRDEFYFSRYFKNNVGISPQFFREAVGFDKAGA